MKRLDSMQSAHPSQTLTQVLTKCDHSCSAFERPAKMQELVRHFIVVVSFDSVVGKWNKCGGRLYSTAVRSPL